MKFCQTLAARDTGPEGTTIANRNRDDFPCKGEIARTFHRKSTIFAWKSRNRIAIASTRNSHLQCITFLCSRGCRKSQRCPACGGHSPSQFQKLAISAHSAAQATKVKVQKKEVTSAGRLRMSRTLVSRLLYYKIIFCKVAHDEFPKLEALQCSHLRTDGMFSHVTPFNSCLDVRDACFAAATCAGLLCARCSLYSLWPSPSWVMACLYNLAPPEALWRYFLYRVMPVAAASQISQISFVLVLMGYRTISHNLLQNRVSHRCVCWSHGCVCLKLGAKGGGYYTFLGGSAHSPEKISRDMGCVAVRRPAESRNGFFVSVLILSVTHLRPTTSETSGGGTPRDLWKLAVGLLCRYCLEDLLRILAANLVRILVQI